MSSNFAAHIVILNYNGAAFLPECLPSIATAQKKGRVRTQVTLLDNLSTDNGVEYVQKNFPQFRIEKARANRILCSYNDFLPKIEESIVILLNNDIRVEPDFIDPLMEKFTQDPLTFLVAPRVMTFDGKTIEAGQTKAGIRFGFFWCDARFPGYASRALQPSQTYSSGFGAFSRGKFLELGGYDDLYLPGIMEDVDLSHRAQKKGYHLYYEPRSVVYHMGQASFKKRFGSKEIAIMAHRNNFLFMWKNFSGPFFWLSHLFFLPFRFLYFLLKGNLAPLQGFVRALQIQRTRPR